MTLKNDFYRIEPQPELLLIQSFLSWDERVALAFVSDIKKMVLAHYTDCKWAVLHDGRQWELGTPQAEEILADLVSTPITDTLVCHAFVTGDSELKHWQIVNVFKDVELFEFKIFKEMGEARAWLAGSGFLMS